MERSTKSNTDRVSKLFMLVCVCFCVSMLVMTYENYYREDAVVKNEDGQMYDDIEFKANEFPVDLVDKHDVRDEESTKAKELYRKVRVLCWIMTSPKNLQTKATAVKLTWAKRCNKFVFVSSETNSSFPTIGLKVEEGRQHLTGKTIQAFKYCFENYGDSYDWFLKADDDTYVIAENLRYFLSHHDPDRLIYFGHRFQAIVKQGYFSGGAGYVLSRKALEKFVNTGLRNPLICRQDGGAEDAEIGKCMEKLGIQIGDSMDLEGRESFHPFTLLAHLQGTYPDWFYKYAFHKAKKGIGCCSDYSVTFHYMSPADMYQMDFLLYHLRPYGIHWKDAKRKVFARPSKPKGVQ